MRVLFILSCTVLLAFVTSCGNKTNTSVATYQNDSIVFFQVNDFFASQVATVNKTPYFIYQATTTAGKTDSLPVSVRVFDSLAAIFTRYDISNKAVKKYYKESAFNDESTHSITLNYSTQQKDLPVQSVDVLLHQETQAVKRIFITIAENAGDTARLYKLSWKANENFSIITSVTLGKEEKITQTTVAWK